MKFQQKGANDHAVSYDRNILLNIKAIYNSMTIAERAVADYVLENPKLTCSMTITDLAEACNVGYTTVFRFCKTLSFSGFTEFKIHLMMALGDESKGDASLLSTAIAKDDSLEVAAEKLMNCHINAITETKGLLDFEALHRAIELISSSDKVCFFGVAGSMISALDGMYKFIHIVPNAYSLPDPHMQLMLASTMTKKDVAVILSHAGENKDIVEIAKRAKMAGAGIIGITQHTRSPLTQYVDIVLACGGFDTPFNDSSSRSTIPQLYILDMLFTGVYYNRYDESKKISMKVADSVAHANY